MMSRNSAIEIIQADNGFLVRPVSFRHSEYTETLMVFETLSGLAEWLREHFSPRIRDDDADAVQSYTNRTAS